MTQSEGQLSTNRRNALNKATEMLIAGFPCIAYNGLPALAEATLTNDSNHFEGYNCLLDLPPIQPNKVRIFLCRHGQTENNRLRLVQGARVDPPINPTGRLMAQSDGETFLKLRQNHQIYPSIIAHSTLLRAKESAEEIAKVVNYDMHEISKVRTLTLSSIGEVDFGPFAEGKPIAEAKAQMSKVYSAWSFGRIDETPELGGESGRIVVSRICDSLYQLTSLAKENGGCIAAVSHSTFLRMLLAVTLDISLLEASSLTQVNGCINVLDVDISEPSKVVGPQSNMFGGKLSFAPKDTAFTFPSVEVVRVNETRHLVGIV